jgi:hypothetical protein
MIYIILIAIFKAFSDCLKVDQFDNSIFSKFKGSKFWDIRVAEKKYHTWNIFMYSLVCISDAWHLSNTIMLSSAFIGIYYGWQTFSIGTHLIGCFVVYAIFFEFTRFILMSKNYKLK